MSEVNEMHAGTLGEFAELLRVYAAVPEEWEFGCEMLVESDPMTEYAAMYAVLDGYTVTLRRKHPLKTIAELTVHDLAESEYDERRWEFVRIEDEMVTVRVRKPVEGASVRNFNTHQPAQVIFDFIKEVRGDV